MGSSPISVAIPPCAPRFAKVAQLVEHAPEKRGVAGSIPALGTFLGAKDAPSPPTARRNHRCRSGIRAAARLCEHDGGYASRRIRRFRSAVRVLCGQIEGPLGFDVDLAHALAAKLGASASIVNHQFNDLLAAVCRGQFDAAILALSDTSAREKIVTFIDYFIAGVGSSFRKVIRCAF